MKIFVRAHDVAKTDEITLAKEVSKLGFDGLQLAINKCIEGETAKYGEISKERINEISNAFKENNVEVCLIGSYFNPVHSNKELVKSNILKFKEHLSFASKFDCLYVGSETGSFNDDKWTYNPLNRTEDAFNEVKEIFKDLANYAKEVNSNISVEGADGHCMYSPLQLKRLVDEIDNGHVFVTIDTYNFLNENNYSKEYQRKIIDQCIELFGNKIKNIHLKDFIMTEEKPLKLVGLGEGLMDLKYIVNKIKENVPDANLIFEGVPRASMENSLKYIKEILGK